MIRSYLVVYNGNTNELEKDLQQQNLDNYIILNNKIASIYVDDNFEEEIFKDINSIYDWTLSIPMSSLIDIDENPENGDRARSVSGVDYIDKNPYISPSGKNTIIVIIDSGINYLHPDFIRDDNTSRIISIWDQSSNKGKPPKDLKFGSEFKAEEINKYIKENDSTLTEDTIGSGTIAAGIAAGNGRLSKAYTGIAKDSELLVVKLREYTGAYKEGKISYELSDFLAAIKYASDVSAKYDKEMVINLTVGEKSKAVILTNFLDSFTYLMRPGTVIVSGSGNEGNTDIHYRGKLQNTKDITDILIQVGQQKILDIIVSAVGPDKISFSIISPSGELSYFLQYSPDEATYRGRFNIEGTNYEMVYGYPWLKSGTQEASIRLIDVKPGIWTLRLKGEFIISGDYDVFLPNKNLIDKDTRFINSNSFSTTTLFATTENVITVGGYNNRTDSLWIESSRGTVNQNPIKPDIVAPGVDIIGPYKNNAYAKSTGTGISSSIVAGISAIIMEYLKSQSKYGRNLLFTEVIKTYLMIGADKQPIYIYPNVDSGYGVLNFQKTLEQIAKKLK
ncbi:MAG: bile acid germinant receptor pseudoprotease CspC [Paraclostridium sp.]|uniref:bile acid germinant receptor pseudoprotease CspC n=1 Tax=Paraclostridium sp. TaxID=2023273 RepID=UPI003F3BA022